MKLRPLFGALAGIVAFIPLVFLCELVFSRLAPLPPGLSPRDPLMAQKVSALSLVLVLCGWALASFLAGLIGARVGRSHRSALVVGLLATIVGISNNLEFPPPLWFWPPTLCAFLPFALLGASVRAGK